MNYSFIKECLTNCGYCVSAVAYNSDEINALKVEQKIGDHKVELLHFYVRELYQMPEFLLNKPSHFDRLAHTTVFQDVDLATICVNVPDSVSVNYEKPELAFIESLNRHIRLLTRALMEPEWNKQELLREFQAGWLSIIGNTESNFICLSESSELEILKVLKPRAGVQMGLATYYLGHPVNWSSENTISLLANQLKKRNQADGLGYIIPLNELIPAPWTENELGEWYLSVLSSLHADVLFKLKNQYRQQRVREIWVIFNGYTSSGRTWFGIHFSLKSSVNGKKHLPLTGANLQDWKLKAIKVSLFNKERLMPRSGAEQRLQDKKVLLVGCGSVGGDIADKLAASGLGHITLCDIDYFTLENLYRHILPINFVSYLKVSSLSASLTHKYPWLSINAKNLTLLQLRSRDFLTKYDLIIIAIGSPTHERLFHDYLLKEKIKVPMINSWVEGYGIGGHATLDIPSKLGCLRCAYVNPKDLSRGLASNLNFLKHNQDITKNHAGCGDAFLPYTYIASTQTSLIAADLAVKYLLERVNESSKVSWKGQADEAIDNGFLVSDRYYAFTRSLEILSLYNNECDICNG
ncbi:MULTISPECIES: ThiF family adenylyltransferase [Xenorhabdus]|uniref:ThiF family adenylyltransferase n=1 Tax=Xenorhabdus TaxID=626 RepID=UPI0006487CFC|nr:MULTISPECIES: ThiF family adenylyltransferase [Xenorhabdus]